MKVCHCGLTDLVPADVAAAYLEAPGSVAPEKEASSVRKQARTAAGTRYQFLGAWPVTGQKPNRGATCRLNVEFSLSMLN